MDTITYTPEKQREIGLADFDASIASLDKLAEKAWENAHDAARACEEMCKAMQDLQDARSNLKFEADIVIELIGAIKGLIPFARNGVMSGIAMSDPVVRPDHAIQRAEAAIAAASYTTF